MTDQELADFIEWRRHEINEITGKPHGIRAIAEEAGVTYGKARYVDQRYNSVAFDGGEAPTFDPGPVITYRPVLAYVWDLETTNLNTFMGQLIAASFLDLATGNLTTRNVNSYSGTHAEQEMQLLEFVVYMLEQGDIFIGHNTIGFDMGFIRGRLAIHGITDALPKRQHWDTYQIARHGFKGKPQGYSLENLLDFFRIEVKKDKPSKHDWAASIILDEDAIDRITERCEHDVIGNALLWEALRPYHHQWKGR